MSTIGWLLFHVVTYTNHIMALRCRVGSRPQHQEQTSRPAAILVVADRVDLVAKHLKATGAFH
jgi:hypothetical protein